MTLIDAVARAVQAWSGEGIDLLPPASESEVRKVFGGLRQRLAADVITLYTTVGGFAANGACDKYLWEFWPLQRIVHRNVPGTSGVVFSDFLVSSHEYQLRYEQEDRSSVWILWSNDEVDARQVASSVSEFFELYLLDPAALHLYPMKD